MTRPVGRIEVWEPGGGSALYTINDAAAIHYKDILTDGIGHFNFLCYSHKDFSGTYSYPNIDLGDTVKIWLDWDTIAGDPNFIGKVYKRSGPLLTETGWVRKIAGLSQGEILLRRQKKNKKYSGVGASTIVAEWATDLGIYDAADIATDTTSINLEVQTKTYFDLLRWISDYYDAGGSVKKDFYVAVDNDLHWKARPIRVAGVESLTTADFLADPLVVRDLDPVGNSITVYGAPEKHYPSDKDLVTEQDDSETPADDGWTIADGSPSLSWDSSTHCVGSESVEGQTTSATMTMTNSLPGETSLDCTSWKVESFKGLHFWAHVASTASTIADIILQARVLAPNTSNYWGAYLIGLGKTRVSALDRWFEIDLPFIWNPDVFTDPIWDIKIGSPDWSDVQAVAFYANFGGGGTSSLFIDGLHFRDCPFSGSASDATSISAYGQFDLEITDKKLMSDAECDARAETELYRLKDPPTQITCTVKGNDNVLIGDRLSMTIPSEGISSASYDVIAVENLLDLVNYTWITTPTMVNSVNWRVPFQSRLEVETFRRLRELGMDERLVQ